MGPSLEFEKEMDALFRGKAEVLLNVSGVGIFEAAKNADDFFHCFHFSGWQRAERLGIFAG